MRIKVDFGLGLVAMRVLWVHLKIGVLILMTIRHKPVTGSNQDLSELARLLTDHLARLQLCTELEANMIQVRATQQQCREVLQCRQLLRSEITFVFALVVPACP